MHGVFLGQAMGNLAATYLKLGRLQEAMSLQQKTLRLLRRSQPRDDEALGETTGSRLFACLFDRVSRQSDKQPSKHVRTDGDVSRVSNVERGGS
jgi:hypothetical protein